MKLENKSGLGAPQESTSLLPRIWDWLTAPSAKLRDIGEQRSARLAASFLLSIFVLLLFPVVIRALRSSIQEALAGSFGIAVGATLIAYSLSRSSWRREW